MDNGRGPVDGCQACVVSEVWSLPGYEVQALVDGGSAGDLWCARELATGDVVALRRRARGADEVDLRRAVALQADLPYTVRLRDVVDDGQVLVLVLDHAPGGSLETLLAHRGPLEPGEVVTIGVPLAEALAAAHARGLVHGELTASSVLFGADGMPLLAGLGLHGSPAGPEDDVAALAALCDALLGPVHVGASARPGLAQLWAVLDSGRSADPGTRPDAAAFAARLRRCAPATPVRLARAPSPAPAGAQVRGGRFRGRRPSSDARLAGALVLLVFAGAGVGWWSGRGGEQAVPATAAGSGAVAEGVRAASGVADWAAVLDGLDDQRAAAFAASDETALEAVYTPGAPALPSDRRLVQDLAAEGRTAHGVRHTVREVTELVATTDRVRLRVVAAMSAYDVRDATGRVVARTPAGAPRTWVVELDHTPQGWRVLSVTRER